MQAYDGIGRLGSAAGAENKIAVTEWTVGGHIKALDSEIGIRLFRKHSLSKVPTVDGAQPFNEIASAFASLRQAEQNLSRWNVNRPFTLLAPTETLLRVIIPNVTTIQSALGSRPLQFVSDDTEIGPSNPAHTMAIRVGKAEDMPKARVRLCGDAAGLVLSPRLMDEETHDVREVVSRQTWLLPQDQPDLWDDWMRKTGVILQESPNKTVFEKMYMALQAAEAGLGPTVAPLALVGEALEAGRLSAPFGFYNRTGAYYAVSDCETYHDVDFRKVCGALTALLR